MKIEDIEKYFRETPDDVIKQQWEKHSHHDNVGPTVDEYLAFLSVNKLIDGEIYMIYDGDIWWVFEFLFYDKENNGYVIYGKNIIYYNDDFDIIDKEHDTLPLMYYDETKKIDVASEKLKKEHEKLFKSKQKIGTIMLDILELERKLATAKKAEDNVEKTKGFCDKYQSKIRNS